MSEAITVLDPTAGSTVTATQLIRRPESLLNLVVGYLDNGKPNSDAFLALLEGNLAGQHPGEIVRMRKANIGKVADDAIIAELAGRCDVVITGVGDCAGCCSCTVHDAVALERRGIPTYVVCTSEMLTTATLAAAAAGVRSYPFTVIAHPLGSLTAEVLADRAAHATEQIIASQTSASQPAAPVTREVVDAVHG